MFKLILSRFSATGCSRGVFLRLIIIRHSLNRRNVRVSALYPFSFLGFPNFGLVVFQRFFWNPVQRICDSTHKFPQSVTGSCRYRMELERALFAELPELFELGPVGGGV